MILVSTGVIDIGRKSVLDLAVATFGTGRITALFHWRGTTEEDKNKLNSLASCLLKTGAPSLRNQAGRLSKPVAVWCNILNTRYYCAIRWSVIKQIGRVITCRWTNGQTRHTVAVQQRRHIVDSHYSRSARLDVDRHMWHMQPPNSHAEVTQLPVTRQQTENLI